MEKNEKQIEYQFTAIPTMLYLLLDNNCRSMLFTLIQLSTYYSNAEGYFFRTNEDLQFQSNLSKNLVIATIDTLYINDIVEVKTVGKSKGKYTNLYKLNFEKIVEFDKLSIEDAKNPANKIETVAYKNNYQPQYIKYYLIENEKDSNECKEPRKRTRKKTRKEVRKRTRKEPRKKVNTNIDNIDSLEDIEYIENKDNKEDNIYNNKYSNIYKEKIGETANADSVNGTANANSSFNNFDKIETKDVVEMNSLVDELFPEIPTEDNSNEMANADVTNGVADANSSFNIDLNKSLENNSNKTVISIENKKECNSSIEEESSNREQINSTDGGVNKANETANAKNKLKMKQEAKEYFKAIINEVNYLNRTNSNNVSKLKSYYDVINTLSIDEDDKKEMLDKCNDYIKEISSKKTVNKADSSTLNEKTTDSSIEKKSLNTEPKNDTNANVNKEESSKLQQASRSMEYKRYFNNIQVALSKRCLGTLVQYEKDFQKKVEYLSDEELDDLRNMIADAKHRVQLAMRA